MVKKTNLKKYFKDAEKAFIDQKFDVAMRIFAMILSYYPDNQDAKVGVLLSDFAEENPDEAMMLMDYYTVIKSETHDNALETMESLLNSLDTNVDTLHQFFETEILEKLQEQDGITYEDFKFLLERKENIKQLFEDILFSTRVVIVGKEQFIDFLNILIDNGYTDIALNYLDSASELYRNDLEIEKLFHKLKGTGNSDSKM